MEDDAVAPDLVLFSNLIHLALRGGDAPKALALFSRLRGAAGIKPDLKAYNAAIAANRLLLHDMPSDGVAPDAESYSPILAVLARRGRHLAVVSLFTHMRVKPDLSVFNIVLKAYAQPPGVHAAAVVGGFLFLLGLRHDELGVVIDGSHARAR
uniref:Pentacotripeptide-repeat region of PRORP domain-containing protein n=1 Tax=Oryza glumipatula TaxID=40148 RepID=A0A0D9YL79_9ORYZ